jgi:hypothetical protein
MTPDNNKKRVPFKQYMRETRKIWFIIFFSATAIGYVGDLLLQSPGLVLVCCGAMIFSTFMAIFDR